MLGVSCRKPGGILRLGAGNPAGGGWTYGGGITSVPFRPKCEAEASKCWSLNTLAEAEACRGSAASCGPFAPGNTHVYPYGGLSNPRVNYSDYMFASNKDMEHAVKLPAPNNIRIPLDMWQVVVRIAHLDNPGHNDNGWGGTAEAGNKASLVNGGQVETGYPQPYNSSAHEFGHVFGCLHSDREFVPLPEPFLNITEGYSVMATQAAGDPDGVSPGSIKAPRFGMACSSRMIGASLNKFNSRAGPAGGPSFGYTASP